MDIKETTNYTMTPAYNIIIRAEKVDLLLQRPSKKCFLSKCHVTQPDKAMDQVLTRQFVNNI